MKPQKSSLVLYPVLAAMLCFTAGPASAMGSSGLVAATPKPLESARPTSPAPLPGQRLKSLASQLKEQGSLRHVSLFRGGELVWSGPARAMETEINNRLRQQEDQRPADRMAFGNERSDYDGPHCALVEGHIYIGEDGRLKKEPDTVICDDM